MANETSVVIYTDGACTGNLGPGGVGVLLVRGAHRKELSAGYRLTTNNRMELMAAIIGLRALEKPVKVTLYTDSKYLVDAVTKGWARRWRANGWRRNKREKAKNPDLWRELLDLCDQHDVRFRWVKGHDGNLENERCDQLAVQSIRRGELRVDAGYENDHLRRQPALFE
ncbi:MAG: ribonuclease HI [Anaerolineales bacterium]